MTRYSERMAIIAEEKLAAEEEDEIYLSADGKNLMHAIQLGPLAFMRSEVNRIDLAIRGAGSEYQELIDRADAIASGYASMTRGEAFVARDRLHQIARQVGVQI